MTVSHSDNMQNAITNLVVDSLDVGAGANATLEFQTSAGAALAVLTFGTTAFGNSGASVVGLATANAMTPESNATAGIVAKAAMKDQDGVEKVLCAVGTSGSDINISSLTLSSGDQVTMTSLTYKGPT